MVFGGGCGGGSCYAALLAFSPAFSHPCTELWVDRRQLRLSPGSRQQPLVEHRDYLVMDLQISVGACVCVCVCVCGEGVKREEDRGVGGLPVQCTDG